MTSVDQQWTDLRTLDEASLVPALRDRMVAMNQQPEDQRTASLVSVLQAEAELDSADLRRLTAARFHAWLTMPADEVQAFSASLDAARALTPGPAAVRASGADQTAARDLTSDECMRLIELAPSFERALPREMRDMIGAIARQEGPAARAETAAAGRPFWKFWQR